MLRTRRAAGAAAKQKNSLQRATISPEPRTPSPSPSNTSDSEVAFRPRRAAAVVCKRKYTEPALDTPERPKKKQKTSASFPKPADGAPVSTKRIPGPTVADQLPPAPKSARVMPAQVERSSTQLLEPVASQVSAQSTTGVSVVEVCPGWDTQKGKQLLPNFLTDENESVQSAASRSSGGNSTGVLRPSVEGLTVMQIRSILLHVRNVMREDEYVDGVAGLEPVCQYTLIKFCFDYISGRTVRRRKKYNEQK